MKLVLVAVSSLYLCGCLADKPTCSEAVGTFVSSGCGLVGANDEELSHQEIFDLICIQMDCPSCKKEHDDLVECWSGLQPGECLDCGTSLGIFSSCVTANDC